MADVIIIVIIAITLFFVVRGELRKLRRGQCSGGCAGCSGGCKHPVERVKNDTKS